MVEDSLVSDAYYSMNAKLLHIEFPYSSRFTEMVLGVKGLFSLATMFNLRTDPVKVLSFDALNHHKFRVIDLKNNMIKVA